MNVNLYPNGEPGVSQQKEEARFLVSGNEVAKDSWTRCLLPGSPSCGAAWGPGWGASSAPRFPAWRPATFPTAESP